MFAAFKYELVYSGSYFYISAFVQWELVSTCESSINRDISLAHFDEVFKHCGLRSVKYGGDFGITQSVLSAFERNSHIVGQIKAVND